jgi:Protein of unknown function (DUF3237)
VNLTHEGLSLWYGTPDALAPEEDAVLPRRGNSVVIGVRPASPTNSVCVRYRVDGGHVQSIPARELRTDYQRQAQYFGASFPPFPTGSVVEYAPVLSNAGRQVPAPHMAERFPSRFRLAEREAPAAAPVRSAAPAASKLRFPARLDFVATVSVDFGEIQFVGDTPAGMRVNFNVREGTVEGEGFRARVAEGASDQMIIRRDGMGMVRIRAAFATQDGAMLDVESGGYVDFGPEGYQRALAHHLPDRCPLVVSPLISTRHPKYQWLGRVQCVGVGLTHLDVGKASYDVYSAMPRDIPATR